ncbi:glycosyltransferase [Butyricimonas paravirosa]|uniref:glycosyltransferase n=1 Tax=Butyricimonas paravirosa TaxID=1472417 RepID=UPI0022E1D667|nr:glycosyltransferase [Butyricimonas paravirosa]
MKKIYLFTNFYPYSKNSENFLDSELEVVNQEVLAEVYIIPLHKEQFCRILPEHIKLCDELAETTRLRKIVVGLKMLYSKWFWKLPFSKDPPCSVKEIFCAFKYLYGAFLIKDFLLRRKSYFDVEGIFYSYWFNHTPLGLWWAKNADIKYKNYPIYTRAHGFDVYERNVGIYFPYREETLRNITTVFVVSQTGCSYLQYHYADYKDKIKLSHLGVFPIVEKYVDKGKISGDLSFVSCSSVIPVKRVECIFKILNEYCQKNSQIKITWMHIGGGKGLDNLLHLIQNCADNLIISIQGVIDNSHIRELYRNRHFDIFINLSSSEGIPVSIMEAISAGIPVIATDVGGNHEIVVTETGKLLPLEFTFEQFEEAISHILRSMSQYRKSTLNFYASTFSASENYTKFYRDLIGK